MQCVERAGSGGFGNFRRGIASSGFQFDDIQARPVGAQLFPRGGQAGALRQPGAVRSTRASR